MMKKYVLFIFVFSMLSSQQRFIDEVFDEVQITDNIVNSIPTLIEKKIDLFSSTVNQKLNGI